MVQFNFNHTRSKIGRSRQNRRSEQGEQGKQAERGEQDKQAERGEQTEQSEQIEPIWLGPTSHMASKMLGFNQNWAKRAY